MNEVIVRVAAAGDADALAALITALGTPTSREEMAERLGRIVSRPDFATFVAEEAGAVVGMVGACVLPSYARNALNGHILALVVAPEARGRGAGTRLMAQAEAWLRGRNVPRVVVNSAHRREAAHAFYERLGYRDTGRRFVKRLPMEEDG